MLPVLTLWLQMQLGTCISTQVPVPSHGLLAVIPNAATTTSSITTPTKLREPMCNTALLALLVATVNSRCRNLAKGITSHLLPLSREPVLVAGRAWPDKRGCAGQHSTLSMLLCLLTWHLLLLFGCLGQLAHLGVRCACCATRVLCHATELQCLAPRLLLGFLERATA